MYYYTSCNTRVLHGLVANETIEGGVHAAKCGDLVANDQGFAEYTIKRTKDKLKLEGTEGEQQKHETHKRLFIYFIETMML